MIVSFLFFFILSTLQTAHPFIKTLLPTQQQQQQQVPHTIRVPSARIMRWLLTGYRHKKHYFFLNKRIISTKILTTVSAVGEDDYDYFNPEDKGTIVTESATVYDLDRIAIREAYTTAVEEYRQEERKMRRSVARSSNTSLVDDAAASEEEEDDMFAVDEELTEEELDEVMEEALGAKHVEALNAAVTTAMEDEYDRQEGVNTVTKPQLPLQMNLDLWTYQARKIMQTDGNFTEAMEIYQDCVEYDPTDSRGWMGMARIHWKRRRLDLAQKAYKDGLYYCPKNPYLLQGWAVMLEKVGQLEKAERLLIQSVKSNPTHAASWVALGQLYKRKGDVVSAGNCYRSAVQGDPKSYGAKQALGTFEAQYGSVEAARELFNDALDIAPRSYHSLHAWANMEKRLGNFSAAEALLKRQVEISKYPNTRILQSLADVMEQRGAEPWRVRQVFESGKYRATRRGDAGYFQAWAMFEQRQLAYTQRLLKRQQLRHKDEVDQLRDEEEHRSEDDLLAAVGTSSSMNDDDSAFHSPSINDMEEQKSIAKTTADGDDATLSSAASISLADDIEATSEQIVEQTARIRRHFKSAVSLNKYHSASWVAWAKFEQKLHNYEVARKLLVTGISNFPTSVNIAFFHSALASLCREQGDFATARACYQRALTTSPPGKSLPLLVEFAAMEANCGRLKDASKLLEVAKKRFPDDERLQLAIEDLDAAMNTP